MTRFVPIAALLTILTACQQQIPPESRESAIAGNAGDVQPPPATVPPVTPAPSSRSTTTADPSKPPPAHLDPDAPPIPAETSALGAARRLQEYCDAVATKRFDDAYRLWSDNGKASGMTAVQFRESFAKYRAYDCHIGTPGDTEGAAGSIYVEIPLRVTGMLTRGGGFVLEGPVTLRRVNDVDGSTAEQRRWHIASSGLKPRP